MTGEKTVDVRRDVPQSFEVFLEIIDEAPVWDRVDMRYQRCGIVVEVVTA